MIPLVQGILVKFIEAETGGFQGMEGGGNGKILSRGTKVQLPKIKKF